MITAIGFFLIGACAGAYMVFRHLKELRLPGWVAIAHGLAGATGFAVLLLFCLREPAVTPARYALGILVAAVALGSINVVYHLRGVRHRLALILVHALVAVGGVGTLAYAAAVYAGHSSIEPPPPPPGPAPSPVPIAKEPQPTPGPTQAATVVAVVTAPPHETVAPALGPTWSDLRVRFDSNSDRPTPASEPALATIARALADAPSIQLVEVQGHADSRGSGLANVELTRARARAVVNELVARGVAPARLRSAGYGSRCPARDECRGPEAPPACQADDALAEDRRVTFAVVESGGQQLAGSPACDLGAGR